MPKNDTEAHLSHLASLALQMGMIASATAADLGASTAAGRQPLAAGTAPPAHIDEAVKEVAEQPEVPLSDWSEWTLAWGQGTKQK